MRIAFYAPLKAPDHPVPSGDRQLARALMQALVRAGHQVRLECRLRTYDAGDPGRQARLVALGGRSVRILRARYRRGLPPPELWFTYHVHHKAPDVVGPAVSGALAIPYVIAEGSFAPKQASGRWATGHRAAERALAAATAVLSVNPVDVEGIRGVRGTRAEDKLLPPFLDVAAFTAPIGTRPVPQARRRTRLVCVAMMREGAKLASYRLLASALGRLADLPWELTVIGDGPAREAVERALSALGPERVRFEGRLDRPALARTLAACDIFAWPAIGEAFGMALLEAQACGLPVVAGNAGGVAAVVGAGGRLVPEGDVEAFAQALRGLIVDVPLRRSMGRAARARILARHDLQAAANELAAWLAAIATSSHPRLGTP